MNLNEKGSDESAEIDMSVYVQYGSLWCFMYKVAMALITC